MVTSWVPGTRLVVSRGIFWGNLGDSGLISDRDWLVFCVWFTRRFVIFKNNLWLVLRLLVRLVILTLACYCVNQLCILKCEKKCHWLLSWHHWPFPSFRKNLSIIIDTDATIVNLGDSVRLIAGHHQPDCNQCQMQANCLVILLIFWY